MKGVWEKGGSEEVGEAQRNGGGWEVGIGE